MTAVFRNKTSPATGGAVSLTTLNATPSSGPSSFTGQSVGTAGGTAVADPSGKQASVVKVTPAAALARLDWKPGDLTATKVSSSHRIRLDTQPTGNPWQVTNLQAGVVDAGGTITGQATAVALNWVKGANSLQVQRGPSKYDTLAITLIPGQFMTFNVWFDLVANTVGVAVYDEVGNLIGTQTLTGTALSASAGASIVAGQWGKTSTGNTAATAYVSSVAVDLGVANDLGASPSMAVSTPPTTWPVPHMVVDSGRQVVVYSRAIPTTSGAAEAGITTTVLSAKMDKAHGSAPLTIIPSDHTTTSGEAPQLMFSAPSVTSTTTPQGKSVAVEPGRHQWATAPFCPWTVIYTCQTTGTDSNGLQSKVTHQITVRGHVVWLAGKPAKPTRGTRP